VQLDTTSYPFLTKRFFMAVPSWALGNATIIPDNVFPPNFIQS